MLKRYIGPYDEVSVSVAGNDFGTVKQGEALVVPDELAESVGWSEHWEDVNDTNINREEVKNPLGGDVNPDDANERIADTSINEEGN